MAIMTPDPPRLRTPGDSYSVLSAAPIAIVAAFIIAANVFLVGFRLQLPYPISPWEAGIVTDAWRMLQGESVYAAGAAQATHMYGPLTIMSLAGVFEFTGPTLLPGRVVSAISGAVVVISLAAIFSRGGRLALVVAVAILLAANSRTGNYFVEARPDMVSALFATLALIVLYLGSESKARSSRLWLTLAGSGLMVVAVMFKQTAAAFAFVPLLALLARFDRVLFRERWEYAAIPVAGLLLAMGAVWVFAPGLWHLMIEVPAQYRISILRAGRIAVELLASFPLFILALTHWLLTDLRETMRSPRTRWLVATMICAASSSVVAYAKEGGNINCLLPAILAFGAFCVWRAPLGLAILRDVGRPPATRMAVAALFAGLLFAQTYPLPGPLTWEAVVGGHGVDDRTKVIAEVRLLPGKIVSPDDPTIALIAKRYAGKTAVFEIDAVAWAPDRFHRIWLEIDSADYVIVMRPGQDAQVKTAVGYGTDEATLLMRGFIKDRFTTTSTPVYELWRRPVSPL